MTLALIVFMGGALTIFSPCILPVLPFVFAGGERRFLTSGLPMLIGMALSFAGIGTLAAVGGSWAVRINQYGRGAALTLLTIFALTLLSPRLADWLARPFVALGNRLTQAQRGAGSAGPFGSALLGVATGLLWAPCAGPILGLILTGAALAGPNARTTGLLLAYAAGAAASLAAALLAGRRVFGILKRSLGTGEWVRRGLGVAVLLAVCAIVLGWDSSILARLSLSGTNRLEQTLLDRADPSLRPAAEAQQPGTPGQADAARQAGALQTAAVMPTAGEPGMLPVQGDLPSLAGAVAWLNSPPLTALELRGKVVVVDFWTYSCINCLRALPYVRGWYSKYRDYGLVVLGVHAPEFAFEKDAGNVRRAVADLRITYPVALDNNYAIWQAFGNRYWPAHYFIDAQGRIRAHHFGEGDYAGSEAIVRRLLVEAGAQDLPAAGNVEPAAAGVQAAADEPHVQSPETYLGYARAANFYSAGGFAMDRDHAYTASGELGLNQWALDGSWKVETDKAVLGARAGRILFRFQSRDLHLVLGPAANNRPVHFRVTLDGAPPGADHGTDVDAQGRGVVERQRLYQLIRQSGEVQQHVFSIEFTDPGAQAYSFTFG